MPPKTNPLDNIGLIKLLNASAEAINNRPLQSSIRFNGVKPTITNVYPDHASALKGTAAASAVAATGGPIVQELANAYMFRVPNYLNALSQPGLNNKVNAVQGALMVEGAGALSDMGMKGLLAIIAASNPETLPAMPFVAPVANFAKDYVSGITIDPAIMKYAQTNGIGNYLPKSWNNPNNAVDAFVTKKAQEGYANHPFTKYVAPALKNVDATNVGRAVGNMYNSVKSVLPNQPVTKDRPFVSTDFTP